jgi:hypothetical protein
MANAPHNAEHYWIGDHLGERFALHLLARMHETADRVQAALRQTTDKQKVPVLSTIVATLRSLPTSFQAGLARDIAARANRKLARVGAHTETRLGFTMDSLSLVDDGQMRIEIAVTRAVQSMRDEIGAEFYALTRRICHLTGQDDISDRDNPVYTPTLLDALMEALRTNVEGEVTLIAMFEALMPEAERAIIEAYRDVNADMVKRGVLIEIKDVLIRQAAPSPSHAAAAAAGAQGTAPARTSTGATSYEGGAARAPAALVHTGINEALPKPAPLQTLLRHDATQPQPAVAPIAPSASARSSLASTPAGADAKRRITVSETAIVVDKPTPGTLLALAFERIKHDPLLAPAGSAVWNLLFPAVLSLAEREDLRAANGVLAGRDDAALTVIASDTLGVLTCLNRFAEYIVTLAPRQDALDSKYDAMLRMAEWLATAAKVSDSAFSMAGDRIDAAIDQHEYEVAARLSETKTIADFEVFDQARSAARTAIEAALKRGNVPKRVKQLAEEVGFDLLISDYLNGGVQGALWQRDVETFDLLIDSLKPARTREDRARLATIVPEIVARLAAGLPRTTRRESDLRGLLDDLKPLYERASQGLEPEPIDSREAIARIVADGDADRTTALAPLPNLRDLRWVAFSERQGESTVETRCRIAWVSPAKTVYLFRHHDTREYFALTLADLSQRFRGGHARAVDGLECVSAYLGAGTREVGAANGSALSI